MLAKSADIELPTGQIEVTPLSDGGMGSFRIGNQCKRFGKQAAQIQFKDTDGTLVSAVLNIDENGSLFEVDIWKVDFSPLKQWPAEEQLKTCN